MLQMKEELLCVCWAEWWEPGRASAFGLSTPAKQTEKFQHYLEYCVKTIDLVQPYISIIFLDCHWVPNMGPPRGLPVPQPGILLPWLAPSSTFRCWLKCYCPWEHPLCIETLLTICLSHLFFFSAIALLTLWSCIIYWLITNTART